MRKTTAKPRSMKLPDNRPLSVGDVLKVERRYVVDGVVTCVTDKGRFGGVESVGSLEHIVIDTAEGTRMIPLASVSEIEVVERGRSPRAPSGDRDPAYH